MAITRLKTWVAGEVLNASDLNSEFNNIINAGLDLIFPATEALDLNGFELIFDSDADTSITVDTDDIIDIRIGGVDSIAFGHGSTNTGAFALFDPGAFTATASTSVGRVRVGNTNALTVPAGTTAVAASLFVEEPNLTATGTITEAASLYIEAAPTEGSVNYALHVDAGKVKLDGALEVDGTTTLGLGIDVASAGALTLGADGNYFDITGSTTITSIATLAVGTVVKLHFDAALTLTHHATDLILPDGQNITTAAGDEAEFVEYASGDWRCTSFSPARGRLLRTTTYTTATTDTWTKGAGTRSVRVRLRGGGGGSGGIGNASGTGSTAGGGQGGYSEKFFSVTGVATATYTVGAAGAAGALGNNNGGTGGTTSFGAGPDLQATGGAGSLGNAGATASSLGAAAGIGSLGDLNLRGAPGDVNTSGGGGQGGGEGGGLGIIAAGDGTAGVSGGGAGGALTTGTTERAGAAGGAGWIVVEEYS
jgi:hypothetical protein